MRITGQTTEIDVGLGNFLQRTSSRPFCLLAGAILTLLTGCDGKLFHLGKPSNEEVADALGVITLISGSTVASVNACNAQNNGYLCSVTLETPTAHGSKRRIDRQYLLTFGRNHHWVVQTSD